MPWQPPVLGGRPAHRKPWAPAQRLRPFTPRKRGRAGQRDRAAVVADEPLCRHCLAQGRTRATEIVDHIKPLAWGGSDERSNKQGLCREHHDEKSAAERSIDADRRRPADA